MLNFRGFVIHEKLLGLFKMVKVSIICQRWWQVLDEVLHVIIAEIVKNRRVHVLSVRK